MRRFSPLESRLLYDQDRHYPRESGHKVLRPLKYQIPSQVGETNQAVLAEPELGWLRAEISKAESEIAERMGDAVADAGDDQADAGAKTFQREHELALTHNARELLAQNERALARIVSGTYGVCESCGEPIGKARLQAFPRATLCVACKQREERR